MIRSMILAIVIGAAPAVLAAAASPTVVSQLRRAFSVRQISIKRGDVIRFENADEFLHHVYVRSPAFSFNSGEQEPGRSIEIGFPVTGSFDVRCEVHPRMLLTVSVQ